MNTKTTFGLILIIALTVTANYAQEYTFTTTAANVTASMARLSLPGLNGNSKAIIVATPLGNTQSLNPHVIGAWYYNNKWHIFNTDHANMAEGLAFKVEVFLQPDANHFLHVITKDNLIGDVSYLDNGALNKNPNAQITIFQNHAPDYRSAYLNKYETTTEYDPNNGKWYIKNVNGGHLFPDTAYNVVVISSGGTIGATPSSLLPTATSSQIQTPLTVVIRTELAFDTSNNFVLAANQCTSKIYENPGILITDTAIVTTQSFYGGKYPTTTAVVGPGGVQIVCCNWDDHLYAVGIPMSNRKFNILVLR